MDGDGDLKIFWTDQGRTKLSKTEAHFRRHLEIGLQQIDFLYQHAIKLEAKDKRDRELESMCRTN